jgi:hypothetical protein
VGEVGVEENAARLLWGTSQVRGHHIELLKSMWRHV